MKNPCFYILASQRNGTLYTGVTSDLAGRIWQHRNKRDASGFAARYNVTRLVWYEAYDTMEDAIRREKHLKAWKRAWKIRLIEECNPNWDDLYETLA